MAPPRYMSTVSLLAAWLFLLAVFDAINLLRSLVEPLAKVSPLFLPASAGFSAAALESGAFKPLFRLLLALLVVVRLNAAVEIRNLAMWRVTAVVHVLEALYFAHVSFFSDCGALGPLGPRKPPAPAVLVMGTIVLNAVAFTCWWFWLRVRERREASGEQQRQLDEDRRRQAAQLQAGSNAHLESEDEEATEDEHEVDGGDEDDEEDDEQEDNADEEEAADERAGRGARRGGSGAARPADEDDGRRAPAVAPRRRQQ